MRTIKSVVGVEKKTQVDSEKGDCTQATAGGLPGRIPPLLVELVAGGFPALQVNRTGEILWSCNAPAGVLQSLGVVGQRLTDTRIEPDWNTRLWENQWGSGTEQQLRLIGPRYDCGCTGVVVWSRLTPDILSVCLMPLGSIDAGVDPLWYQILAGVSATIHL